VSPSGEREATIRALVSGAVIGVLLAAGNVYTVFKVGVIDGGSITAALLAFAMFGGFKRLQRTPYSALENNITQTAAASAAVMSFVTGVAGPIPALALMGTQFPSAAVMLFGAAVGLLGVFVAALLRRRLVVEEALPFPTGIATGEVIETIFSARHIALRRILLLAVAAGVAGAVTWFRDGRPAVIPQGFMVGGTLAGVAVAKLGVGFSCSPLMLATGAMVGVRGAAGMLAGGTIAKLVLAPWLLRAGIVADADYGSFNRWLVWPALGLLVSGSFLPLLLDGGTLVRSLRQLAVWRSTPAGAPRSNDGSVAPRLWGPLLLASVTVIFLLGWLVFGINPLVTVGALVLALVLANVAARATGETDFSPGGPMGTVSLMATASRGPVTGIMSGALSLGMTSQTSQTLWAFRAGHHLGASPRAQIGAQILGVLVGAAVTVPVYFVIASSYGIGNERMPAVAALSWRATAEAMQGLTALPRWGAAAGMIGVAAGAGLTLLGRARLGRILPSAASLGVGFMLPPSLTLVALAGALLALGAVRLWRDRGIDQASILALAAGAMAGESTVGVIIAILMTIGLL
jgi:uncharacterized oligopeptide transporter (OPT) family protein